MKNKLKTVLAKEKARFILVGTFNTGLDIALLFVLVFLCAIRPEFANVISTSVALCVSYLLNKKAVFRDDSGGNSLKFFKFVTVTLFSLWVIQGSVLYILPSLMPHDGLIVIGWVSLLFMKAVATLCSMVWNYLMYSRFVFKKS